MVTDKINWPKENTHHGCSHASYASDANHPTERIGSGFQIFSFLSTYTILKLVQLTIIFIEASLYR